MVYVQVYRSICCFSIQHAYLTFCNRTPDRSFKFFLSFLFRKEICQSLNHLWIIYYHKILHDTLIVTIIVSNE